MRRRAFSMKLLFKSAVTLTFITIICVIASFLLSAMRKLYIESWFVFNPSILIGLISGLILTSVISLANFHQLQRGHAKELALELSDFTKESISLRSMLQTLQNEQGVFVISDEKHHDLELALALLNECSTKIMRCERISPLKSVTIRKLKNFATRIAKSEFAFYLAFSTFAESCHAAYHIHSILPYVKDEVDRQKIQDDFFRNLQQVFEALQPRSALEEALQQYGNEINKFLGVMQPKS
jgi:hypothetical protein